MPTYDYRCAKCGEELEVFQTFAETPLTKHKGCGGKLAKVLSPAGIVLKGSGFYKTDNRSSSSKRSAAKDKDASNGKSSDSGSASESKSETKSDTKSSDSSSGSSDKKTDSSSGSTSSDKKPAAKTA